jgi:hypothetical protein
MSAKFTRPEVTAAARGSGVFSFVCKAWSIPRGGGNGGVMCTCGAWKIAGMAGELCAKLSRGRSLCDMERGGVGNGRGETTCGCKCVSGRWAGEREREREGKRREGKRVLDCRNSLLLSLFFVHFFFYTFYRNIQTRS